MDISFFQKQPKSSLFSRKTVFKYKTSERKMKKEPPKRVFKPRKSTLWALFCSIILFPLLLKAVRAVEQIAGQVGPAPTTSPAGGAVAAGVAGGVGALGAVAVGSAGFTAAMAALVPVTGAAAGAGSGPIIAFFTGAAAALINNPIGWIILIVAIIVIALLLALMLSGACNNCQMCEQCSGGQSPTPQDTTAVQQGVSSQANTGASSTSTAS